MKSFSLTEKLTESTAWRVLPFSVSNVFETFSALNMEFIKVTTFPNRLDTYSKPFRIAQLLGQPLPRVLLRFKKVEHAVHYRSHDSDADHAGHHDIR